MNTEVTEVPDTDNPFNKAIGITLVQHTWGTRRKVTHGKGKAKVQVQADGQEIDERALTLTKKLLKCDEYDEIAKADRRVHDQLERLSLPSFLRRGVHLVPFDRVAEVNEIIEEYMARRETLVDAFLAVYDRAIANAEEALGPLFDKTQYPKSKTIRRRFGVERHWINLGLPSNLADVDEAIARVAGKHLQSEMRDAANEMRAAMRSGLTELWSHLTEQLTGTTPTGRPKVLRPEAVAKVTDWLSLFGSKNLTNDQQLQAVVAKCRSILDGVDLEELRTKGPARDLITAQIEAANKELAALVQEMPRRMFDFDEED